MIAKRNNLGNAIFDFSEFELILLQLDEDMAKYEVADKINLRKLEPKSKRLINRLTFYIESEETNLRDLLGSDIKRVKNKNGQEYELIDP